MDLTTEEQWTMVREYKEVFAHNHVINPAIYMDWAINHYILCGVICNAMSIKGQIIAKTLNRKYQDSTLLIPKSLCKYVLREIQKYNSTINLLKVCITEDGKMSLYCPQ